MLLLSRFKILGHSMEPFIKNKDEVLISSMVYLFKSPRVNDIVAFKQRNGKVLIKRITKINSSGYFVLGDNKKDSLDSRSFGIILKNKILGKVIFRF